MTRRRVISLRPLVVATALLLVVAAGGCGADEESGALAGVVRTPALDVASIELPDASGKPTAMRAAPGELLLVYFGYTSCPDICPTTMSDISVALADLPDELSQRVTVAMATVDPERDSPEVVTGYLGHFFDRSLALRTEDPAQLETATDAFGVRFEVEDHAAGSTSYEVSHSAVTYVVDDTGTVAVEWPFGFDSEDMSSDIRTLLQEDSP